MHGLGAVGGDVVRPAGIVNGLPDGSAVIRRHINLEAQFTGEADAKQQ
jgi:hypothetical protein